MASREDTLIAKLEWSNLAGGSDLQLRDAVGILSVRGRELDLSYIERWVTALGLEHLWQRVRQTFG